MTIHHLVADLSFEARNGSVGDDEFDAFVGRVMDELDKLQECDSGIVDPDIVGSIAQRTMSVTMGVEAASAEDASRLFVANVRVALHAAECETREWPYFAPVETVPEVRHLDAGVG